MLQNAYFLAKIGADTAENEQHFAKKLPKICLRSRPRGRPSAACRPGQSAASGPPRATSAVSFGAPRAPPSPVPKNAAEPTSDYLQKYPFPVGYFPSFAWFPDWILKSQQRYNRDQAFQNLDYYPVLPPAACLLLGHRSNDGDRDRPLALPRDWRGAPTMWSGMRGASSRQLGTTTMTDRWVDKLWRARSRLYQSHILQANMRLKGLAEIYTMHSFALL